jgi:hypothetical protein
MAMTKKHFIAASKIVAENYNATDLVQPINGLTIAQKRMVLGLISRSMEDAFVEFFRADNSRFDESRFREACKK